MTWSNTAWGKVCVAAHAVVETYAGPGAAAPYFPDVVLGIGVDEYARHDKSGPSLAFVGPGRLAGEERLVPTVRGAAPPGKRAVRDRLVPVRCRIYVPFAKTDSNSDTSPELAEDLYELVLAALDEVAHGRACELENAAMAGGTTGTDGTTIVLAFSLRFTVYAPALRRAKPTVSDVSAVETTSPDGDVSGVAVPGD